MVALFVILTAYIEIGESYVQLKNLVENHENQGVWTVWVLLNVSRHLTQSAIALAKSSERTQCVGVHWRRSLMSSSLHSWQYPAYVARPTRTMFMRWELNDRSVLVAISRIYSRQHIESLCSYRLVFISGVFLKF